MFNKVFYHCEIFIYYLTENSYFLNVPFYIFAQKKMRIFSVLFCLVGIVSFAQTDVIENSNFQTNSSNMTYGTGAWAKSKPLDTSIQGSEYLFPSWDGNFLVTSKQGNQYKLFNLNYNLNTKKLETVMGKDSVFQYDVSQIDYIKSFNRKYKAINNEFYQELVQGDKISFLKGFYVSVMDGVVNPLTQQYTTPNRYIQKNKYFYLKGEQFQEIKLKKSDVLKVFDDKAEVIKKYAKEKNLSFGDENDVASLFRYYNTL